MSEVVLQRVVGDAIGAHLDALAALRIAVFREWPYLYEGSADYERKYLATYARSAHSLVVIARDGERIVGAATAMPLTQHSDDVVPPLAAAGYAPERVFYFGESVLDPSYRGRGLGHRFLAEREAFAREHGYAVATFCAVVRPADHPARPADYRSLAPLWTKHGFIERQDIATTFSWQDVGESTETAKPMVFWTKELR